SRGTNGKILSLQSGERSLSFTYGGNGFISQIRDGVGRTVNYAYNAQNRLASVTAPDGGVTSYTYVDDTEFPATAACAGIPGGQRIKTISRPGFPQPTTIVYGPGHRVLKETFPDGTESNFGYTVVGACVTHISNPTVQCTANCPNVDSLANFQ